MTIKLRVLLKWVAISTGLAFWGCLALAILGALIGTFAGAVIGSGLWTACHLFTC